jgi:outer membrane immunogenic protein
MRPVAMLLLCVVALADGSAGAEAADKKVVRKAKPIAKAPPPAPSSGGTGFYVGFNAGYGWGRATFSQLPFLDNTTDVRGGMAGLTFGYNAQSGSIVYGLETDIDAAWMKATNLAAPPCFACEIQLRYFGTLRGRLGYAVGQALPYITAGLAYGSVRISAPLIATSQSDTGIGWTAGAGLEYAVGGPWSVKAEYLYFELDNLNCGILSCGAETTVKLKGSMVRGGANYRF